MGRRGTWMRNLLGAVGTAVLVPVGLLVAVAVAAAVGGGGLGGLGQLVGGPTLPGEDPVVIALGGIDGTGTTSSQVPAIPRGRDAPRERTTAERTSGSGSGGAGTGRAPGSGNADGAGAGTGSGGDQTAGTTGSGSGPGSVSQPPGTAPPASTPAPSGGGTPTPAPQPDPLGDVVRGVGQVVDGVVRPLPVLGPPTADAVGTVIDLVAPPRRAPAPAATPAP